MSTTLFPILIKLSRSMVSFTTSTMRLNKPGFSMYWTPIYALSVFTCFAINARAQTNIEFVDVTAVSGINFNYNFGDDTYENILESSGSGVTILDYDKDGWMDIYLLNATYIEGISDASGKKYHGTTNKLYRNNGDGTFKETSRLAGLANSQWSMEAAAFDYDGDGDTDIFLLNYGPNIFYQNNGDGTFTDITQMLGLSGPEKLNGFTKWSVSAAFFDYNIDGLTDIMVGNFLAFDPKHISTAYPDLMPHPSEYHGQASLLYMQLPNGGFQEVTELAGIYYPESKCMGLTVFDYDNDGDLDIFQGNDHQANFMFSNDGDYGYQEVGKISGLALNDRGEVTGSMHGTPGDIDGDGKIDLLVTDLKHGAMYHNIGQGVYEDITSKSGIAYQFAGKGQWGSLLFDYDNDGDLDIFTANGNAETLVLQLPLLLDNDGSGYFNNYGKNYGDYFNEKHSGRGAAYIDYDNDGDLDLIVSHVDLKRSPVLLKNELGNANHWLGITLIDPESPASVVGVRVEVNSGDDKFVHINQNATSYLSYNDPRIHVGLGKNSLIEKLSICWPGGSLEEFNNIASNQYIIIVRGEGIIIDN